MTNDYKFYAFPIDGEGNILGIEKDSRPILSAGCQRDAAFGRKGRLKDKKFDDYAGILVVLSPLPYKDLDIHEHKDLYDYWIYDRDGYCCSPGEGPRDPFS